MNSNSAGAGSSPLRWSMAGQGDKLVHIPAIDPLSKKREFPKVLRLPVVHELGASESCVCYTWQYGKAPWISVFMPSLQAWAMRHRIELKIDYQEAIGKGLRVSPYRQWIEHFLAGEFAWMMHMDADVMVHPLAPHVLHESRERGLWSHGQAFPLSREAMWRQWVKQSYEETVPSDFVYANDGVWLLDRDTAAALLPLTEGYIAPNVPHEFYFNWWRLCLSRAQPERVKMLDAKWNRLPVTSQKMQAAWFYHCAGRDKGAVLRELQLNGFLPVARPSMTFKPWPEKAEFSCLIAMPYRADGDVWKGLMLRYALRSLDQYGPAEWPLIVWGMECPEWLDESVFRYEDMLQRKVLRSFELAEKVLWMNDDILLLRPTTVDEMADPIYLDRNVIDDIPEWMQSTNKYVVGCAVIAARLHHELGIDYLPDFVTHTHFVFDRKLARETIEHFGIWFKFPLELAYYGLSKAEGRKCTQKATIDQLDDPTMRWFNAPDSEVENQGFREWLERKFPHPSRWEKSSV